MRKWTLKWIGTVVLVALAITLVGVVHSRAVYETNDDGVCWYWMNKAHEGAEIARALGGDNEQVLAYYGKHWTEWNNLRKEIVARKQEEAQRQEQERKKAEAEKQQSMVSLGTFKITHYCPCSICNGGYKGTSTGAAMTVGETIAVDPNVIPYWSHVMINGHEYIAEDCGAFSGNHIDVLVGDHSTALAMGTYNTEVYLVK